MIERLRSIVLKNDTVNGRRFDRVIRILIIISLVCFSLGTLPDISTPVMNLLNVLEILIVIVFTIEYLLRLFLTEKKLRFIFSFYGLVDLAAILPFYVATGLDLRSIRALRLLRLFRALKLSQYSKAISRLQNSLVMIKEELIMFSALTLILLFLSAAGIYYFENPAQPEAFNSIFDCFWWAVTSLTTVGYGDMYPITAGGKIFTFFVLMIGLGIVAVPSGLFASALSKSREEEKK
jgi:voltage-gated potassium channel